MVKLMAMAGYVACGMEMSPAVIEMGRQWFGVDIIQGPIEYAQLSSELFDVILMFDVIEHFADPVTTMQSFVERLSPNGTVFIQTPVYNSETDLKYRHFKPIEHPYLFYRSGLTEFLLRLGLKFTVEEPALFPNDIFIIASRVELPCRTDEEIANSLLATPDGRMILAMQDLYRSLHEQHPDLSTRFGVRALLTGLLGAVPRAIQRRFTKR
jgi:SAM-dependent methyltransferase